jgi:PPOX class probable F420-dependent enzyme
VDAGTLDKLPNWAAVLLREERVGRLGLVDDVGAPRVLPVTYAVHDGCVWSAIDRKPKRAGEPARVRWLRAHPTAALTVDRYRDDWEALAWVQVLGDVQVLDASQAGGGLAALAGKYPQYSRELPPGPVLRLVPARVLWWSATAR